MSAEVWGKYIRAARENPQGVGRQGMTVVMAEKIWAGSLGVFQMF